MQPSHPNNLTSLALVKALLDLGADVNKPFIGALHSTTLCCGASINSSPFYRAATAADIEVLKLMLGKGAKIEWSPSEIKPKDGKPAGRPNPNIGKTPIMAAIKGGMGAPIAGGPGFTRIGPPEFREPGSRDPLEALKLLLAAGADPNVKAPDGTTPLHEAVQELQVPMIRALVGAGGKLDAVNKDNLTPLLLAEKPKKPDPLDMGDQDVYKPKHNSKEEVIASLRELMHLGPNDPAPQPPPLPATDKKDDKKDEKKVTGDKEKKTTAVAAVTERAMSRILITAALVSVGIAAPVIFLSAPLMAQTAGAPAEGWGSRRRQIPRVRESILHRVSQQPREESRGGPGQSGIGGLRRSARARRHLGASAAEAERAGDAASGRSSAS